MADEDAQLAPFRHLVGKRLVPDTQTPGPNEFRAQDLPASTRILPPDSMMTMDWNPTRLNVDLDANNVATGVRFG